MRASSYDAAVCHLAKHTPHVVCIDVGLPAESGHSEDMAFARAVAALRASRIDRVSREPSPTVPSAEIGASTAARRAPAHTCIRARPIVN